MYVDDIEITNDVFTLDTVKIDTDFWLTRSEYEDGNTWYKFGCHKDNNWQATFIETFKEPQKNPSGSQLEPSKNRELIDMQTMQMFVGQSVLFPTTTNVQWGELPDLEASHTKSEHSMVLIVSNRADHILPSIYYIALL